MRSHSGASGCQGDGRRRGSRLPIHKKLAAYRVEVDELIGLYFEDNHVLQDYLLTRAVRV
jgi:hypothetical protein